MSISWELENQIRNYSYKNPYSKPTVEQPLIVYPGFRTGVLREMMGLSFNKDEYGFFYDGSTLENLEDGIKKGTVILQDPLEYVTATCLHFQKIGREFRWVFSPTKNSICNTKRCRPVVISHVRD